STDSFPLFGYGLDDYDALYAAKLDLLLAANRSERVTWSGPFRGLPLENALVVPRPDAPLKIWLGTGGNPESSIRAGLLGLPVSYGVLGGTTERWVQIADLYRRAFAQSGHPGTAEVSVASHGFIAADSSAARDIYYQHEGRMMGAFAASRGGSAPPRSYFEAAYGPGGMIMVGGPEEIAGRLVDFHRALGHTRHIIQMDVGHMPQHLVLESIRLLGTEVLPRVRAALA
ncbi:MAG: hypothetical protein JWR01_1535, partial [Subtercola sp.]|nr:hypothetical protein [Subtercola sp.]